ncbi:MAG TPA: hypothetical protein PKW79_07290, partial [Rhabdochlamydiaceae bacterium]|nr:hypothetical protein [Rhabdochlamydiaceae bacterium]
VVQVSTYPFFTLTMYPSDDALTDSCQWGRAVHVINTAVVTACIATAFGVALPTAKGMILTAGLFTGVRYAMVYMQSQGSHHHATYSRQHD